MLVMSKIVKTEVTTADRDMLTHFSHDHPLIFSSVIVKAGKTVVCCGCTKKISSSSAYVCTKCDFRLHKECAEALREIDHPMHPHRPLTLLASPPYHEIDCICNICRKTAQKQFMYHCFLCNFDACVSCTSKESIFKLDCHHHPLTLKQRKASFYCDACNTINEDFPYLCSSCPVWIHKRCASSPRTIKFTEHGHNLTLSYSFVPTNFERLCHICQGSLLPTTWSYECADCQYFVHLNCVRLKII